MKKIFLGIVIFVSVSLVSVYASALPFADAETSAKENTGSAAEAVIISPAKRKFDSIVLLDVPYINQRRGFPNGCEAVSTVMLLQYLGYDITPSEFIASYLDMGQAPYYKNGAMYGCDPRQQFPGDPRSKGGWGCYPEVIKKAVDAYSPEGHTAYVLKDVSLSVLCSEYLDNGMPVVFWGTIDMLSPGYGVSWRIDGTGATHTWISPFHCLLLVGYDGGGYYFNDPWRKKNIYYSRDAVEKSYSGMGREALVILENDGE